MEKLKCPLEFTWEKLAEAISKMPEEFKSSQVWMSIQDNAQFTRVVSLETIQEDIWQYVDDDDGEDCGTLDDLKSAHGDEFDITNYRLCTKKGTPFLHDGF